MIPGLSSLLAAAVDILVSSFVDCALVHLWDTVQHINTEAQTKQQQIWALFRNTVNQTFQILHDSFVFPNTVLQLTTGFLQVSLKLLVLLLQFSQSLSAFIPASRCLLPLRQRAWRTVDDDVRAHFYRLTRSIYREIQKDRLFVQKQQIIIQITLHHILSTLSISLSFCSCASFNTRLSLSSLI